MSRTPRWKTEGPDRFSTPGPRPGMTIELRRAKGGGSAWEGRFMFAVSSTVVTKTFDAADAESAQVLAWSAAEDWGR